MASIPWRGDQYLSQLKLASAANLQAAAYFLQGKIRQAISVANSPRVRLRSGNYVGLNPSRPGEPPRKLSGSLRRSIAVSLNPGRTVARVGTNLIYGKTLELGRKNSMTIVAGPGKMIPIAIAAGRVRPKAGRSAKFNANNFIFRKQVTIGPMAPRPFLVPTLNRYRDEIGRIAAVNRKV